MQKKILETLLAKYERSKSFNNQNKVNQSFSVEPQKIFHQYGDDSQVDFCMELNSVLMNLEKLNFVDVLWETPSRAKRLSLNVDNAEAVYSYLGRVSRKCEQEWLLEVLHKYLKTPSICLKKYVERQIALIEDNKNVEYYSGNRRDFEDLLFAVEFVSENENEMFVRNASLLLFKDSKRLEALSTTVESLLKKYGDYEGCENVLAECNIVKTPTQVLVKGNGVLNFSDQKINLSKGFGDLGLSTETLQNLVSVDILGQRVVTIENLTSFYTYKNLNDFVIYLGGFHNSVKREFIKLVAKNNPQKQYFHFGDIDAGGFYILLHLRKKTAVDFIPLNMDVETLKQYSENAKQLTRLDQERLKRLMGYSEFESVVAYMLENNCKLEQENVMDIC